MDAALEHLRASLEDSTKGPSAKNVARLVDSWKALSICEGDVQGLDEAMIDTLDLLASSSSLSAMRELRVALMRTLPQIIPLLEEPRLLLDHLHGMFEAGGELGLAAAQSLVLLMVEYNTEVPFFFRSFHAMLTTPLFSTHFSELLMLTRMVLRSEGLSLLQAKAFVKKLCRVAIHMPLSRTCVLLSAVLEIMARHPGAHAMTRRSQYDKGKGNNCGFEDFQPYLLELEFFLEVPGPVHELASRIKNFSHAHSTSRAPCSISDDQLATTLAELMESRGG